MSFAGSGNTVEISLMAVDNITPVLRGASASMGAFMGDADRMVNSLSRIGAAAAPILAIGAALFYAGQQASQVQQNVANLNSVLHGTSEQLAAIRANGLALSQATQFTDSQILQAQRQLAKGGASPADLAQFGSEGVTGATLNLASATQVDPTKAATAMVTASKAFGLGNEDAARTATLLAQAVDTSVGTLDSQATALRQVGVVARAAGMDMKDTVTTIAALQNQGLGTSTGTSLTTFMLRLEAPTTAAKQAIADLNLQFYNLNGTLKSTPEIFDEIRAKTVGLTDEAANADLEKIFGLRGIRVADIAKEQGGGVLIDQARQMADMGEASDVAARKMDTFQGSASKALSSLNVLAVQMGQTVVPLMKGAADDILSVANALSSINNVMPVIPQVALAAGALGIASKISGGISDNRDQAASKAADTARKENEVRIAAASQYSNAIASAEFAADSKIIAADEALAKQQQALNNQVYEQYIANEEKTVAALNAADEKRLASLNEITAKTLASVHEIEIAYLESADRQVAAQAMTFEKQNAYLAIEQDAARKRLEARNGVGSSGPVGQSVLLDRTQDIDREALLARQAVDQEMLQRELEMKRTAAAQKADMTVGLADEQVMATERATQMQVSAIVAGSNQISLANAEAAAKDSAAMTARAAEEKAAAERVYLSQVGTSGLGPGVGAGAQAVEGSIIAGMKGSGGSPIPVNTKLVAGQVAVDEAGFIAGAKNAFANGMSKMVGGIGQLILPLTVVMLAKEFVINPIEQAVIDHAAGNDPQLNQIKVNTKMVIDNPSSNQQEARAAIDQQTQVVKDELQKKQKELAQEQGAGTENIPILSHFLGDSASIGAKKEQIKDLQGQLSDLSKSGAQIDLIPAATMSKASDEISTIVSRLKDGTVTQAQAEAEWKSWGASVDETTNQLKSHDDYLKSLGLTTEQIISLNKQFADSEDNVAKAVKQAAEDSFAAYRDNARQAMQASQLGVPDDVATGAYFGAHTDQSPISKAQQELDVRIVKQYGDAWKGVQDAVNGVDLTKGINGLADMKRKLDDAVSGLAELGISNPALQGLATIAESFAQITDAEKRAEQAMDGYNLTLTKTNEYMGKLGQVQKDFDQAILAAEYANAAGRATDAQKQLLDNRSTIGKTLLGQQQQLSANLALDVLGEVKNLPDFKALDDYMRDIVDKAGGGLKVVATITTNLDAVKTQLDLVLKDRTMDVTVNPVFSQFDPSIANTAKQWSSYYGNMGGNSPYDQGNNPPPPPPGAPPASGIGPATSFPSGNGSNLNTPRGNAAALDPYRKYIEQASSAYGVPDWAIGSIIMHESGGVAGKREEGGGYGRGLMQVDVGPANNYKYANYEGMLSGTSQQDIAEQISLGTQILRDKIKAAGGDIMKGLQNYAGPAYQSQAGGGVPGGLTLPDELIQFYKNPVTQELHTGGGVGKGGDVGFTDSGGGHAAGGDATADQAATNLRQRIVQTAMQNIDVNKLVAYCEQFVEETVQQATGRRGATGTNEGTASSGFAHAQSLGLVTKNPQPGDLVYYPDASGGTGHVAIYVGMNSQGQQMQVSTWDKGAFPGDSGPNHSAPGNPANARIHLEVVGNGAQFVNSLGQGGVNYGTADPGNRGNATGGTQLARDPFYLTNNQRYFPNIDATDPNNPSANPVPEYLYPNNALPALGSYGRQMGQLDARGQGEMQQFFDRLAPVFSTLAADQKGFGPTGQYGSQGQKPDPFQQQDIDNTALQENLTLTTNIGKAIENINSGLAVTPAMYDAIRASAGPLGDLVVAQVQATAQLEEHTDKLAQLKKDQQDADLAYQQQQQDWQKSNEADQRAQTQKQWSRQAADESVQDNRTAIQRQEQDADASRQRNKTLQDRDIADMRQQQQWAWQDEDQAIQNRTRLQQESQRLQDVADTTHKEALDDAFETQSRAFQDQQRLLEFRGGQDSIALQDARKALDEQHRLTTENAQQTGGLYVSLGKGSQTESQANAFASQAAAIDDARKKADDLYRKQADSNTRQQDALSKQHAQQMFDLETEMLASQRAHADELKNIDRAAEARHNDFSVQMFDLETENIARQRSHELIQRQQTLEDTARSRAYEDQSYFIEQERIQEQRRWQDADESLKKQREQEDQAYTEQKWQQQDLQQSITDAYQTNKKLNADQQQAEQQAISDLDKQISGIDLVISKYDTLLKMFGSAADQVLSGPKSSPSPDGSSASVPGFATGTPSSPSGFAKVNELGGELRFLSSGESILPADQTSRLMSAVLGYNGANNQQSGAQTINGGNVVINLNDAEVRVSATTAEKIRALVRDELQNNAPESPTDSWAARGGLRR